MISKTELVEVVKETLALIDPELAEDNTVVQMATERVLAEADKNKDGVISFEEFSAHFTVAQP